MKTNLKNTKSIVAILFAIVLFSVNVNAQSNHSSNPVKKVIALINDYRLAKAENNIVKLTSLIEEKVKFSAPSVNEVDNARPMLLGYYQSEKSNYLQTNNKKKDVLKNKSLVTKMQITNTQLFREWVTTKLEGRLGDLNKTIKGEIVVKFTIDGNGKLYNPVILKNTDKEVEKLVIEILNNSPQWALENGNSKIEKQFFLPITYIVR